MKYAIETRGHDRLVLVEYRPIAECNMPETVVLCELTGLPEVTAAVRQLLSEASAVAFSVDKVLPWVAGLVDHRHDQWKSDALRSALSRFTR